VKIAVSVVLFMSPAWAITLPEAVDAALKNYPSVRVSQQQTAAAAAAIAVARTAYLPRADVLAQLNRATRNNIFGLLLPQSTLPTISGPPKPENDMTNVWGSAVGFLVSWEPFDFGLRRANVEVAEAGRIRAEAAVERTRLEVATAAADAYLTLLAAQQTRLASEGQRERARTVDRIVRALVQSDLRPGADESRTKAEIAVAETQTIQADLAVAEARILLEQMTGAPAPTLDTDLSRRTPAAAVAGAAPHPALLEQRAAIEEVRARTHALDRSWYPRFMAQASSYARGTGANPDGTTGGPISGIGPNIQNWAVGMTVTFPALELPSIRARKAVEQARLNTEEAREQQLAWEIRTRTLRAEAALNAAIQVAAQTPAQVEAARMGERQARARYESGLANLTELADAQRLLTSAEIDDALARLQIWRARLAVAAAQGDLQPFLDDVQKAMQGN
jgi:outer membrane protein TolC